MNEMDKKRVLYLFFSLLIHFLSFSQKADTSDSKKYDSLIHLYNKKKLDPDLERFRLIELLYKGSFDGENSLSERIEFLLEGISILEELDSINLIIEAYNNLGHLYWLNGTPDKSIEAVNKVLDLALISNNIYWVGNAYSNLATSFQLQKQYERAHGYEKKALDIFIFRKDSLLIFNGLSNLSEIDYHLKRYEDSFRTAQKAMLYRRTDDEAYIYVDAYLQTTLALLLARKGEYDSARALITYSGDVLSHYDFNLDQRLAYSFVELAKIFLEAASIETSIEFATKGFEIGTDHQLKEVIQDGALVLGQAYEYQNQYAKSINFYKTYYTYRDSIINVENVKQIESLRADFEINQKQTELDIVEVRRRNQELVSYIIGGILFVMAILAIIVYRSYRQKLALSRQLAMINESKNKLFSIISHDLRGPIAAFSGVGFLIKSAIKTGQNSFLEEVATEVDKSSKQLSSLLDNLLSWAMQEQGGLSVHKEQMETKEVFSELQETFESQSKAKNISIEIDKVDSCQIMADRNMTYTIFRNLISNALKFTPEKGKIMISCMREKDFAKIEVVDTGVGMTQEKVDSIFQFDNKKSTYGTAGEKGLGLGLQLVYEFVEINGGSIHVESEEGKGTSFIVKLPLFVE